MSALRVFFGVWGAIGVMGAAAQEAADPVLTWEERQKILVAELVGEITTGKAEGLVKALPENLRKLVDEKRLKVEVERIAKRFGPAGETDPKTVERQKGKLGSNSAPVFAVKVSFEKGEADCQVFYDNYRPLGFAIRGKAFEADTLGAVKLPAGMVEHATAFWTNLMQGKPEKSYELMIPKGSEDQFPREQFLAIVKQIALPEGLEVADLSVRAVRLDDAAEGNHGGVRIYQLMQLSDHRNAACRLAYAFEEDGSYVLTSFNIGGFDDGYPVSEFGMQESFLTALASGNLEAVVEHVHPSDRGSVHRPTFAAYLERVAKVLGPFRELDPTKFSATWSNDTKERDYTRSAGLVAFEKKTVPVSLVHSFRSIDEFNLDGLEEALHGWPGDIKDTGDLEDYAAKFLREMSSGDPEKAVNMLTRESRDEMKKSWQQLLDSREKFTELVGALKDVTLTKKEFVAKGELWRMEYEMEFETGRASGWVSFYFSPFNAYIDGFHYKRDDAEAGDGNEGGKEPGGEAE